MLRHIHHTGPALLQSDYARGAAVSIAACASLGLLTTVTPDGMRTRSWRLTPDGLHAAYTGEVYL